MMKKQLYIIAAVLVFLLVGCSSQLRKLTMTPHLTVTPASLPTATLTENAENILPGEPDILLDPTIAPPLTATPESLPAATPTENAESILQVELDILLDPTIANEIDKQFSKDTDNLMWQDVEPGFIVYTLKSYPLENRRMAQIFVYPVNDLEGRSEHSADSLADLRQILQHKPDMGAYSVADGSDPTHFVPHLLPINATPVMHAGVEYLDFQNGTGIRYLTQYNQAVSFLNNEQLCYTFQGLTQDEKYYIAAVLPVRHPDLLPGINDTPDGASDWTDVDNIFQNMREMVQILDEAEPSSFTPDLTKLDVMIRSIRTR